jgi:hypothetical protein
MGRWGKWSDRNLWICLDHCSEIFFTEAKFNNIKKAWSSFTDSIFSVIEYPHLHY